MLNSQIYGEYPGFIFTDINGNRLPVEKIKLSTDYQIETLSNFYEESVDPDTAIFQKYVLSVPGLGEILPGSRVIWREGDYVLLFGWHTNISNQELFTWFLRSVDEDIPDKTLYRSMIDEIELVHFK